MTALQLGTAGGIRPVCFSGRTRPAGMVPHHSPPPGAQAEWALSDACVEAFARLVPILACGEESAIHVFSGAASLAHASDLDHRAASAASVHTLFEIAADEMRHDAWLSNWRARLPDCFDHNARQQARKFFAGLKSEMPAIHFIRIAALDSAVCQILAMLIARDAPLSQVTEIRETLGCIQKDEARHVRISRDCASAWGATPDQIAAEWCAVRAQLVSLFEMVATDFSTLGVDPDILFARLRHAPRFTAEEHA